MSSARPKGAFVGLATLDLVYRLDAAPKANSKNVVEDRGTFAGGPATNAAVAFAALGGEARLTTAIGRHSLGNLIWNDLDRQGVSLVDLIPDFDGLPSVAAVMVSPGGDRLAASTAANLLPPRGLDFDALGDPLPEVLLVDGHLLDECIVASKHARQAGVTVVLDGGSWKPGLERLIAEVDIAICGEDCTPPGCEGPDDVFAFLRALGPRRNAITRGEKTILADDWGVRGEVAVAAIEAVDTLGSGDIFHGAFCYYFALRQGAFLEQLESAAAVATLSAKSFGTREWIDALR
jgi:sugar/nucleoside kinase (ribokinase family)